MSRLRALLRPLLPAAPVTPADRRIVGLLWLAGVMQGYATAHAVNTLPFARVTLGLTEGEMSQILGLSRAGALVAIGFSRWGDARGRKAPFVAAYGLLLVAAAATGLATGPVWYAAVQMVVRMAGAAAGVLGAIIVVESVSVGLRGYAVSVYGAAASLGAGLATAAVAAAGLAPDAWRVLFGSSAAGLVLVPALIRWLHPRPLDRLRSGRWWGHLAADTRRSFAVLAAASAALAAFSAVSASFAFERLVDDIGLSAAAAAAISLAGGTMGGLGFLAGGRLTDTWGRRPTAVLAAGLVVAGGVGLYRVTEVPLLVATVFVAAAGSFMLVPSLGTLRNELFPGPVRSRAVTWINALAVVGSAAGLLYGRAVIDEIGLASTVTRLSAAAVVGGTLLILLPETRPHGSTTVPRRA